MSGRHGRQGHSSGGCILNANFIVLSGRILVGEMSTEITPVVFSHFLFTTFIVGDVFLTRVLV